jgi:hypothetical protein
MLSAFQEIEKATLAFIFSQPSIPSAINIHPAQAFERVFYCNWVFSSHGVRFLPSVALLGDNIPISVLFPLTDSRFLGAFLEDSG